MPLDVFAFIFVAPMMLDFTLIRAGKTVSTTSTFFAQMADCLEDYSTNVTDGSINASSTIGCARACTQNADCLSFTQLTTKNLASRYPYNCGLANVKADDCSELQAVSGARYFYKVIPCYHPWKLVLSQERGNDVSGNRKTLIESIKKGQQVRVLIDGIVDSLRELQLYEADSLWVNGNNVVAQVFTFTRRNLEASVKPMWTKLQANTTGNVTLSVAKDVNFWFIADVKWFIKDTGQLGDASPVLIMENNAISQGSWEDVASLTESGNAIQQVNRMGENDFISYPVRSFGHSTPDKQYAFSFWLDWTFESSSHLSEITSLLTYPNLFVINFLEIDIMDASKRNSFETGQLAFSWTGDHCWSEVYVNDDEGNPVNGSHAHLVRKIKSGSDFRVLYQCNNSAVKQTLRIDRLSVDGETVTANADRLLPMPSFPFEWTHYDIYSNGIVIETILNRNDGSERLNKCHARITWFADTTLRKVSWFYSRKNDSANHFTFPIELVYKGLMPRVVVGTENDSIESYSIQKMVYHSSLGSGYGLNYRKFNQSFLAVTSFDTRHKVSQNKIKLDIDPRCLDDVYSYEPSFITWYF